jgi:peptide/nickel transport system substrate-binding protein
MPPDIESSPAGDPHRPIIRRAFLQVGAAGAVALAAAGCSHPSVATQSAAKSKPRRGGTLQAALTGGTSSDTLDAQNWLQQVDLARINSLNEPLVYMNSRGVPELWLAEEITPNRDANAWTVRVHPDITFHNGKTLSAEDVIFSFRRILNPKNPLEGASAISTLDAANITKLDSRTVRLPFNAPMAIFPELLSTWYYYIVPEGYNPKNPVGTGPFRYHSFTPGVQSVFLRYPDYWKHPLPYVDRLVITDYPDEASQTNALISGQADVINSITAPSIPSVKTAGAKVIVSPGGGYDTITMRVDKPPFSDVRVRQAMRLIADRKQMIDIIFGGYGTLGNDIFGIWAPEYDRSIPQREPDIPKAKALLKAAGYEGLRTQIVTGNYYPGLVDMATIFSQNAKAAGVTVNVDQVTPTVLIGPSYLKWVFSVDAWIYSYYLPQAGYETVKTAPYNEPHFDDPRYNLLYAEAMATVDVKKRYEIEHEMMRIDYDQGGLIIPFFVPIIDGVGAHVYGVVPAKTGVSLNSFSFKEMWIG